MVSGLSVDRGTVLDVVFAKIRRDRRNYRLITLTNLIDEGVHDANVTQADNALNLL